jgi:hypothetical protein
VVTGSDYQAGCPVLAVSVEEDSALVDAAAEGAVAMCRAQRGTEALDRVVAELTALVGAAVER